MTEKKERTNTLAMSSSACTLSPGGSGFSSIVSSVVGSVVNGFTAGYFVAFMTGWISLSALVRTLLCGLWLLYRSATASWEPEDDNDDDEMFHSKNFDNAYEPPSGAIEASKSLYTGSDQAAASKPSLPILRRGSGQEASESKPQRARASDSLGHNATIPPQEFSRTPGFSVQYAETFNPRTYHASLERSASSVRSKRPNFFTVLWPTRTSIRALKQRARIMRQERRRLGSDFNSVRFELNQFNNTYSGRGKKNPPASTWPPLNRDVTAFGWLGWCYVALYAPISQILWVAANASNLNNGAGKIVKGMSVAVTALPLCIDSHVRFADTLRHTRLGGAWA